MTLCHANVRPAALPLSPGGRDRSLRPRRTVCARRAHPGTHPPPPIRPKTLQIPSTTPPPTPDHPEWDIFEAHDRRSAAPGIPSVNTSATRMTGLSRRRDTSSGTPSGRGERRAGIRHRPGGRRWRARRNTLRIDRNGRVTLPCRAGTGDGAPPPSPARPHSSRRSSRRPTGSSSPSWRRRPETPARGRRRWLMRTARAPALTGETEARRHRTPQPLDCRARSAPRRLPAVTAPPDADSYSGPRRGPPRVPGAAESGSEGRRSPGRGQLIPGRHRAERRRGKEPVPVAAGSYPAAWARGELPPVRRKLVVFLAVHGGVVRTAAFVHGGVACGGVSPRGSSSRGSLPRR